MYPNLHAVEHKFNSTQQCSTKNQRAIVLKMYPILHAVEGEKTEASNYSYFLFITGIIGFFIVITYKSIIDHNN